VTPRVANARVTDAAPARVVGGPGCIATSAARFAGEQPRVGAMTHHVGPAAARYQTGDPFHHRPHGIREAVPDRGTLVWDFTRQRRHYAAIAAPFPMVRGQVPGDVVVQSPGVAHACRTRTQGVT
jgi:hypothetical protein